MQIDFGYELIYEFPQPTPMLLMLNVHQSRAADLATPDAMITSPDVPVTTYLDRFGNLCTRLVAPAGQFRVSATGMIRDTGLPDLVPYYAEQHPIEDLPEDTLKYLLGSRYCETDELSNIAWGMFGHIPGGWPRVQAICDWVHNHITFNYAHTRPTKTALQTYQEGNGVCRDYAHLALTLCRCLNIPARYCTGYLWEYYPAGTGPTAEHPHDFAGWLEAFIGGTWHCFDPRNNEPRRGRILIGRGRDATDVAITNTFGPNKLTNFTVWTREHLA
ncbi:MAG: transglutaminase [Acidocella sp. 20-57-95]|nr:MAG: transglutaminase [Acidocella sp. 20-57-95]OYV60986.1 MAG: transglutaminase [Acidocella sp. 21-58-7]HQT64156.1 transglutaminase family protein [Acidocella sp.]HQU03585.1 transglutaminase family protein [Acidocella sp.]